MDTAATGSQMSSLPLKSSYDLSGFGGATTPVLEEMASMKSTIRGFFQGSRYAELNTRKSLERLELENSAERRLNSAKSV